MSAPTVDTAPSPSPSSAAAASSPTRAITMSVRAHSMTGPISSSSAAAASPASSAAQYPIVPGSRSARASTATHTAAAATSTAPASATVRIHTIRTGQRRSSAPSQNDAATAAAAASAQVQGSGTPATPAAAHTTGDAKRIISPSPLVIPSNASSFSPDRVATDQEQAHGLGSAAVAADGTHTNSAAGVASTAVASDGLHANSAAGAANSVRFASSADDGSRTHQSSGVASVIVTPPTLKLYVGKLSPKLASVGSTTGTATSEPPGPVPAFFVPGQMSPDPLAPSAETEKLLIEAFTAVATEPSPHMTPLKSPTPELPPSVGRTGSSSRGNGMLRMASSPRISPGKSPSPDLPPGSNGALRMAMSPGKSPSPELPPTVARIGSSGSNGNGNVTPRMAGMHLPSQMPRSLGTIMSPAPLHPPTHAQAQAQGTQSVVHSQPSPSTHPPATASASASSFALSPSPSSTSRAPATAPPAAALSILSPSASAPAAAPATATQNAAATSGVKRAMSRGPGSPLNASPSPASARTPQQQQSQPPQRRGASPASPPAVPPRFAFPTFRPDGDIDTKYANQLHVARKKLLSKYLLGFAVCYALMEVPYILNKDWEASRHFVPIILRLAVGALFTLAVYVNSRLFVARFITHTTWRFDTLCCGLMTTAAVMLVAMETQRAPAPIDVALTFDGAGNPLTYATISPPLDPVLQDGLLLGLTLLYVFSAGILKIRVLLFGLLGLLSLVSYTVAILVVGHRTNRYLLLSLAYQLVVLAALTYMVFTNERLKALTLAHQKSQYLERKKAEKLLRSMLPERILNDYLDGSIGQLQAIATIGFVQMHLGAWSESEVASPPPPGREALSDSSLHPSDLSSPLPSSPSSAPQQPPPVASPGELMQKLHDTFKRIDGIVNVYAIRGVSKIETVSTTYLLCAGLLQLHEIDDHAAAMIDVSLEILSMVQSRGGIGGRGANGRGKQRVPVLLRIGISSGSVVGGIIGDQRRFFRVFGDTVNVSARMCTTTAMGSIQISEASYDSLSERQRASYKIPPPIVRDIKGKGLMRCYTLESRADWVAKFNKIVMSRGQLDRDEPLLNKSFVYHRLVQITDLRRWSLEFKQTGSLGKQGAKIAAAAIEEDQRNRGGAPAAGKQLQMQLQQRKPAFATQGNVSAGERASGTTRKQQPLVITGVVPSAVPSAGAVTTVAATTNTAASRPPRSHRRTASNSQSVSLAESTSEGTSALIGGTTSGVGVGGSTLLAPTPTAHRRGRSGNMLQSLLGGKSEVQMAEAAATAATGLALVADIGQDPIRNSKRLQINSTGAAAAKDRQLRSQLKQAHLLGTSSALQQTLAEHPFSAAAIERFFQLKFARQFLREVRWSNLIFLAFEIGVLIYVVVYHDPSTREVGSDGQLESERQNLSPSIMASILVALFVAFDTASILRAETFSCCSGRCRGSGGAGSSVGDESELGPERATARPQAQLGCSSAPLPLSLLTDSLGGTDGAFAGSISPASTSHFLRHFQHYALAFATLLMIWVLVILSLGGVDSRTAEIHPVFAMMLLQLYACLSLRLQFRMLAPLMVGSLLTFAAMLVADRQSYVHLLLILSHLAAALFLGLNVLYHFERASRSNFLLAYALEKEQQYMDKFLHNLLPKDVVKLLKKQNPALARTVVGAAANAGGGFLAVDRASTAGAGGATNDGRAAVSSSSPPPLTPSPVPSPLGGGSMMSGDAGLASRFAMHFPTCTVYESDIVGYTKMVSSLSPSETLNLLNLIFSRFDEVSVALGVEKIETIGDAFMCFPDHDTRVLTDRGFLFYDELADLAAQRVPVQYACFDTATGSLMYRPGTLLSFPGDKHELFDFTPEDDQHRWAPNSGPYGDQLPPADGTPSNHFSIRVTGEHTMYAQLGNVSAMSNGSFKLHVAGHESCSGGHRTRVEDPPSKHLARDLWLAECACAADALCEHRRQYARFVSVAEAGGCLPSSGVPTLAEALAPLGLTTADQLEAFLELYGFWLGDGTLSYNSRPAVVFAQLQPDEGKFLVRCLARLPLVHDEDWSISREDGTGLRLLSILNSNWFHLFDAEYGSAGDGKWFWWWTMKLLSVGQQRLVIEGLRRADGHFKDRQRTRSSDSSTSDSSADACSDDVSDSDAHSDSHADSSISDASESTKHASMSGSRSITTSSVRMRDELVLLLIHAGYTPWFEVLYRAGDIRGYTQIVEGLNKVYHATQIVGREHEFAPIHATVDGWLVTWNAPDSCRGQGACFPMMRRSAVRRETYHGRKWCVHVDHPDHLIVAQRAARDDDGVVKKVSVPVVIGNCMVFDGAPDPVLDFALTIVPVLANCSRDASPPQNLEIRMGISTGSCFGGIVGTEIPRFHLFGQAHDVAIHIEQNGRAGDIIVSSSSFDLSHERYDYQKLPELVVDGFQTYLLLGRKGVSTMGASRNSPTDAMARRGSVPLPGSVAAGAGSLRKVAATPSQSPSSLAARNRAAETAAAAVPVVATSERKLAPSSQQLTQPQTTAAASSSSSPPAAATPSTPSSVAVAASREAVELAPIGGLTVSDRHSDSSIVASLGATATTLTNNSSSSTSASGADTGTHGHHRNTSNGNGNGSIPSSPFMGTAVGAGAATASAAGGKRVTPPSAASVSHSVAISRQSKGSGGGGGVGGATIVLLRGASSTAAVSTNAVTPVSEHRVISTQQFVDPATMA